jgi:hypothetical protein
VSHESLQFVIDCRFKSCLIDAKQGKRFVCQRDRAAILEDVPQRGFSTENG